MSPTPLNMVVFFKLIMLLLLAVHSEENEQSTDKEDNGDPVIVLTSDNFTESIEKEDIMLVEFYAPWCGHCKQLAPEYKVAARELKSRDPPIPLAKVDAIANEDLARKYEIDGYPIMKVFRKGVPYEYEGPRKADGIIQYMKHEARSDWKPPVDQVLVLTRENFTDITENSDLILVEFYAPWCGHCKQLAPQYKKAADMLHRANSGIKLAKIDGAVETELAKEFGVSGYPTMKMIRRGLVSEYGGPRDAKGIATYMMKQAQPAVTLLLSAKELNALLKEDTPVVVGVFINDESPELEAYAHLANEGREEPLIFKYVTDLSLALKYKLDVDTISVFLPRQLQSKYESNIKRYIGSVRVSPQETLKALKDLSRPLVGIRSRANVVSVYNRYPVLVGYISNEEGENSFNYWRAKLITLAKKYSDITFAISDEVEFKEELKLLNLNDKMEDIVIALWTSEREKYIYTDDDVATSDIDKFLIDFKTGKIKQFHRSQPIPAKQVGPVQVVVGSTFKEIVEDETKDVLIEFYAPWCGHCKALAPIYKTLAKKYHDNDKLVIAKFDATVNDAPSLYEFSGFPTLFFVAAGTDIKPVVYEGEREVKNMVEFLEEKAVHSLGGGSKDEL